MIQIHNEEACNEAMQLAWKDHCKSPDSNHASFNDKLKFRLGFRYAYMIVELKEAEIDLIDKAIEEPRDRVESHPIDMKLHYGDKK